MSFILLVSCARALQYPLYFKTQWVSSSLSPQTALGWSLSGEVNLQIQYEGSPPDMQVVTKLTRQQPTPWVNLGYYQTYVQFVQPSLSTANTTYYNNYVSTVRYTNTSEKQMSSSDMYQSNSCGNLTLSTIINNKYD